MLKSAADDLKKHFSDYMENILNRADNIVAKEEIAAYEQFLLLPQCFRKSSAEDVSQFIFMIKRVNSCNYLLNKNALVEVRKTLT